MMQISSHRVSPFGNPWIKACLRLPMAYRNLLRPSSAPSAKASSVCTSLLNPQRNWFDTTSVASSSFDCLLFKIFSILPIFSYRKFFLYSMSPLCSFQGSRRVKNPQNITATVSMWSHTHSYVSMSNKLRLHFRFSENTFSIERRWSSRTFRYGYLVTTSPQSSVSP